MNILFPPIRITLFHRLTSIWQSHNSKNLNLILFYFVMTKSTSYQATSSASQTSTEHILKKKRGRGRSQRTTAQQEDRKRQKNTSDWERKKALKSIPTSTTINRFISRSGRTISHASRHGQPVPQTMSGAGSITNPSLCRSNENNSIRDTETEMMMIDDEGPTKHPVSLLGRSLILDIHGERSIGSEGVNHVTNQSNRVSDERIVDVNSHRAQSLCSSHDHHEYTRSPMQNRRWTETQTREIVDPSSASNLNTQPEGQHFNDDGFYDGGFGTHLLPIEFQLTSLDWIDGDNIFDSAQKTASADSDALREKESVDVDQGSPFLIVLI